MSQLGYTLPVLDSDNSVADPLIRTAFSDIKTAYNTDHQAGGHALNLLATGSSGQIIVCNASGVPTYTTGMPDTSLASPNNSVYRTLFQADTFFTGDMAVGTYMMGRMGRTSGTAIANGVDANAIYLPPIFYFDDADYTVAGKTQKLRIRALVTANATQPTITFTFGLYPITVTGTADNLTFTLGTVVTGSTVVAASPLASTPNPYVNTDFTVPADGAYTFGVVTSAQLTNDSAVSLHAQLQTRNI